MNNIGDLLNRVLRKNAPKTPQAERREPTIHVTEPTLEDVKKDGDNRYYVSLSVILNPGSPEEMTYRIKIFVCAYHRQGDQSIQSGAILQPSGIDLPPQTRTLLEKKAKGLVIENLDTLSTRSSTSKAVARAVTT